MASSTERDLTLFDCDGVLVDSEPLVSRVYVEMLAEVGYVIDAEESLREFSGWAMAARFAVLAERLGWSPAPDFEATFHRRFTELVRRELKAVEGVGEVLDGIVGPKCVASNGTIEEIQDRLAITHLLSHFNGALFSASAIGRPKPLPDVYLHAAKTMGARPDRCVVIEDSIPGVRAAVRAGMTVFGYADLTDAAALSAAGARTFAHMSELPALLR